jgi:hypothetical protein
MGQALIGTIPGRIYPMKNCIRLMTFAAIATIAGACSETQPPASQTAVNANPTPTPRRSFKDPEEDRSLPIEKAKIVDLAPAADGGVYALSERGQIWYVKGRQTVRVQEVESFTTRSGPTPTAKMFNFALSTKERRRNRQLTDENQELQEKLYEDQSEHKE